MHQSFLWAKESASFVTVFTLIQSHGDGTELQRKKVHHGGDIFLPWSQPKLVKANTARGSSFYFAAFSSPNVADFSGSVGGLAALVSVGHHSHGLSHTYPQCSCWVLSWWVVPAHSCLKTPTF